jgi:hypothetical protein
MECVDGSADGLNIDIFCKTNLFSRDMPRGDIGFESHRYSMEPTLERDHKDIIGNTDGIRHVLVREPQQRSVFNVPLVKWKHGREGYDSPDKVNEENAKVMQPKWSKGLSYGDKAGILESSNGLLGEVKGEQRYEITDNDNFKMIHCISLDTKLESPDNLTSSLSKLL